MDEDTKHIILIHKKEICIITLGDYSSKKDRLKGVTVQTFSSLEDACKFALFVAHHSGLSLSGNAYNLIDNSSPAS